MAVGTQFHVLVVDDSITDRKLMERLLKTSSFQVSVVDSGNKALEFLGLLDNKGDDSDDNHNDDSNSDSDSDADSVGTTSGNHHCQVNLIMTDYSMPGMTGYDLLRKIKESERFKDIPVMIMSSENVQTRVAQCLEDGAQEFLLKPVRLSDVDQIIRPHLRRTI